MVSNFEVTRVLGLVVSWCVPTSRGGIYSEVALLASRGNARSCFGVAIGWSWMLLGVWG